MGVQEVIQARTLYEAQRNELLRVARSPLVQGTPQEQRAVQALSACEDSLKELVRVAHPHWLHLVPQDAGVETWVLFEPELREPAAPKPMQPSVMDAKPDDPKLSPNALDQIRPPFLRFLNRVYDELGTAAIEEMKKPDLEAEIRLRWPPEFGSPSSNMIPVMATMLRSLKAKRGGARPQKPSPK